MSLRILIADNDTFRREYVLSGLVPLGVTIVGPTLTSSEACNLLESSSIADVVIMSDRLDDGPADQLISAVRRLGIPHLVLVGSERPAVHELAASSVLQKPFAAFQVADWVISLERQK